MGVTNGEDNILQEVVDVVYAHCCEWRLNANVCKSAVLVFARKLVDGTWQWGDHDLPRVPKYTNLTLNQPRTHKCVQRLHMSIRIYWRAGASGPNGAIFLYTTAYVV